MKLTRTRISGTFHEETLVHPPTAPLDSQAATKFPRYIFFLRTHTVTLPFRNPSTMTSNRLRRIAKELGDIQNDTDSKIFAEPADGQDLSHLKASFPGPPDTPYEGGTYIVDIKIPHEYPFRPPQMQFQTKLWHPNVSSQTVCSPYALDGMSLLSSG